MTFDNSQNVKFSEINGEVEKISAEFNVLPNKSFEVYCLKYVHQLKDDDAFAQTDTLQGTGGDKGVDGWHLDDSTKQFYIWQCKWSTNNTPYDISPLKEALDGALSLIIDERRQTLDSKLQVIGEKLISALSSGCSLTINLGILAGITGAAEQLIEEQIADFKSALPANIGSLAKDDFKIEVEIWDIDRFIQEDVFRLPEERDLSGQNVTFKLASKDFLYLTGTPLPAGWSMLLACVDGRSIGSAVGHHGLKLFGRNVRYGLTERKISTKVHETISIKEAAPFFVFYNNGLTVLCENIKQTDKNGQVIDPKSGHGAEVIIEPSDRKRMSDRYSFSQDAKEE